MRKLLTIFFLLGMIVGTAYGKELTASWYYLPGKIMANGKEYKNDFHCATRDYPLGTKLQIKIAKDNGKDRKQVSSKSIICLVTDRINKRFKDKRIDLTPLAFSQLGKLETGLISVTVEEVK